MVRRVLPLVVLLVVAALSLTCKGKTGITGQVILQTGQTGDVRNCKIQLFEKSDLTGTPVKEVSSAATGTDQTKAAFEFTDVVPGYYYILAWKDLNGTGIIDNLDIVGVYGGTYKVGYGGSQVTVTDGKMTDIGQVEMLIYKQLIMTASATRRPDDGAIYFTYSFSDGCSVTRFKIIGPTADVNWEDGDQNGDKVANQQYKSPKPEGYAWTWQGNAPPAGAWTLHTEGTWGGASFTIDYPLTVPALTVP